jgi:site-specific recombinase XerD
MQRMNPDFELLSVSWELTLRADGYAPNSIASYRAALRSLAAYFATEAPGTGPAELTRDHVRGWLAHIRTTRSASTARAWISGVRHFCRWLVEEGEADQDATKGVKIPNAPEPETRVLSAEEMRALLAASSGSDFAARRDTAILMLFLDGGLRLAELSGLTVDDLKLRDYMVLVAGKGSRRSGPRPRMATFGVKTARALDRYLRERRRHPHAYRPDLWLGDRGRPTLSFEGVSSMVSRRGALAGIKDLHPHQLRHTWASHFRADGGSEGDLMVLGGWRSRHMLDRYGRTAAADRAAEAARRHSLGDRL